MTNTNGVIISEESSLERDLDILVDNELTFDVHLSQNIKKANKKVALIKISFTTKTQRKYQSLKGAVGATE